MAIDVRISGNAIQVINATRVKMEKLTPFLRKAAMYQERSTKLNFAKQSDPDGNKWASLSAITLKTKKSGAILRETSALISSISSTIADKSAIVTANQAYGIFHQTGTSKMPQRQFLGISDRDKEKIMQIAQKLLVP
jgi:phage virion morphogenesis protein